MIAFTVRKPFLDGAMRPSYEAPGMTIDFNSRTDGRGSGASAKNPRSPDVSIHMKAKIAGLLLASLVAGCNRRSPAAASVSESKDKSVAALSALGYVARPQSRNASPQAAPEQVASAPSPLRPSSLKLIWTASLQIEVANFRTAVDQAGKAVVALGGYVSDRQSTDDGGGHERGQITLRVPSDRFDGAVSALKNLGRVRSEAVQTQDVTKAYADLETRLKVKRETATRLRDILSRQTGKVSEVLEVEREIARVIEEIEQAEGERRYFDNQISLSTITVSFHEPDAMVTPGALDPVVSALRQSLRTMGESFGFLIELGAALLPWLFAVTLAFRLVRWRLRRRV